MEVQSAPYTDLATKTRRTAQTTAWPMARHIAMLHGFTLDQLQKPGRKTEAVTARWAIIAVLSKAPYGLNNCALGRMLHRDHSTIYNAHVRMAAIREELLR